MGSDWKGSDDRERLRREIAFLKDRLYDAFNRAEGDCDHPEVQEASRRVDEKVLAYMKLEPADQRWHHQ